MERPFKIHADPGPRPRWVNDKGQHITSRDESEARARQSVLMNWEQSVLLFGFQQRRFEVAVDREEKRQLNILKFGLDPVVATRTLQERRRR